jgi:flagellar biosynthesis protein FliR
MLWLSQLGAPKLLLFTLVLARVSGLVMTAPIYGTRQAPMQVRALLSFALALVVLPSQWHVTIEDPGTTLNYLVFVGAELLIGLCLGLGVDVFFSGLQLAGQVIGRTGGLQLADVFDPTVDDNVPIFSQFLYMLGLAVFLCAGGHRIVMAGLLDTFQSIPPGGRAIPDSIAPTLVLLLSQSFSLALRAAAPVMTALLLATLVLGFIGRTLPQLNVLMLGFSLNALLTFAVLLASVGASVWVFGEQFEPALERLLESLHVELRLDFLP